MGKMSDLLVDPHGVSDKMLKHAEFELLQGYKDCDINYQYGTAEPISVTFRIIHPTQGIDVIVSDSYTRKFNELLSDETLKTWDELQIMLNKRGIWTDQDEERYNKQDDLIRECATKVALYSRNNKLDKKKRSPKEEKQFQKAKEQFDVLNVELEQLSFKRLKYYLQTIEGLANQYAQYVKLIHCVFVEAETDKNGEKEWIRMWDTIDDLNNENAFNKRAISEISTVAMTFWSGIAQEILDYLPDLDQVGEETQDDS